MKRVNEVMREVIGAAISSELEDPRIGFVTITAVETSPDLRSARVYVSVLGSEQEREQTLAGLRSSHGVLQAAIARETRMKRTPTLTFHYDESSERAARLSRLLGARGSTRGGRDLAGPAGPGREAEEPAGPAGPGREAEEPAD